MSTSSNFFLSLVVFTLAAGCGSPMSGTSDSGIATDAGRSSDSGRAVDASGTDAATTPRVTATVPLPLAIDVGINTSVSATFTEAMDPTSLTLSTFTVTAGTPAVVVAGRLIHAHGGTTVVFLPTDPLARTTTFTATVTSAATSVGGVSLAADYVWTFTTGTTTTSTLPVDLGGAGDFAMLAMSGISTVPDSIITGDLGVSPAAATYITGFSLTADATNVFSTSTQVTGRVYASDYAVPTPANLTTAVADLHLAYTDAAGRAPGVTELGAGNIGGMTLPAGVYAWGTGLLIPTDVTLAGSGTDVWIFQIAQDLTMSSGARVALTGGALPQNVFWQVAGRVEIGTTAHCEGIVMTYTSIDLRTGASIHGRLMAQTAVNIASSTVVEP